MSLLKGKGSTLQRGNYRGLKLTDHVLKVVERVIFFVRQLQEKVLDKKNPYFASIDFKKAFEAYQVKYYDGLCVL